MGHLQCVDYADVCIYVMPGMKFRIERHVKNIAVIRIPPFDTAVIN